MVWLSDARTPEGMRLYAIGDVHGCLHALAGLHRAVEADLRRRPTADWRIIHLGDYVDRGADSRGVIEFLLSRAAEDTRVLCLRGNHDEMFAQALAGRRQATEVWLINGGGETLESYGVPVMRFLDALRSGKPGSAFPDAHRSFLDELRTSARFGDYYFVHAGINPGSALDAQTREDQLWIREPFLTSGREFEAVVVHGHTPVRRVELHRNRIGIDTGAVYGGSLTCLVLDGGAKALLSPAGLAPLPGSA